MGQIYDFIYNLLPYLGMWLHGFLRSLGLSEEAMFLVVGLIKAFLLVNFGLIGFAILTYVERKIVARFQDRLGPNVAGPYGILQPVADGIKLLTKEDTMPAGADRWVYNLAPLIIATCALAPLVVIPFGPGAIGADLHIGVLYALAVGAGALVGVLMAGWGSNNKYALLGAFRAVAQLISYEIPSVLSVVIVVMIAGTMSTVGIVQAQDVPYLFVLPVAALVFLLSGVAEVGRTPFDLLEAESEIVAGFHIEYSGMKFALVFLGEFVHALVVSALFAVLFLGGWRGPWLPPYLWMLIKMSVGIFLFFWLRATLPRIRIDQMLNLNWKFLTPLMILNLIGVALVDRGLRAAGVSGGMWAAGLFLFNVAMLIGALALPGYLGRRARMAALAAEAEAEAVEAPVAAH
ncbi:MAG: NADH-quinone oxidoreductase subunit NuoH [Thermoflexus hugenholtzii]|jgi:NADH-quinone oxidoreductase subunit H|uniref:NADH-quinone oxidoreductase subunit NuoH n=1 Tax=Thermoflexus TaxID=1495649 RepID=UPI001C7925E5|nr:MULTISPECIES: NADH-quinone oxidoreductase subunit NuoH [Thermoflexus]QWK11451.1 MAG: NADH-quinone oxidoreductase subunit NuoH [Thermoflexus hugenholtzii]